MADSNQDALYDPDHHVDQQCCIASGYAFSRISKVFIGLYRSVLVLLLVLAVVLSVSLGEYSNSVIMLSVLLLTGVLGYIQERNAGRAMERLQLLVKTRSTVRRGGVEEDVLVEEVAPGDIVLINAGDIIPADAYILESNDLHVNESASTWLRVFW